MRPTKRELNKIYSDALSLVKHNGSVASEINPIKEAAKHFGYTTDGIRRIFKVKLKKWRPIHTEIIEHIKNNCAENQQVTN